MMKGFFRILIFIVGVCCAYGCTRKASVKEDVMLMKKHTVLLDLNSLECCVNDTSILSDDMEKSAQWIVYADSAECSSCFLKQTGAWEAFCRKIKAQGENVGCTIIVFPQKGEYDAIKEEIQKSCSCPVYIDTAGLFERNNPQIPHAPMYHTFLLDKDDKVVLVGNPLRNEHIRSLFEKWMKKSMGQ